MSDTQATPKVLPRKSMDRNFGVESFKHNRWSYDLDETESLEDAQRPEFWAGVVDKISGHDKQGGRGDIIAVRKLDSGLYAELLILELGPGYIRTQLVRESIPAEVTVPEDSGLTTRWNVGKRAHDVIRVSDKQVMAGGFQTKAGAAEWINKHTKAMAA